MFKVKVGITSEIMKDIFEIKEKPYNLRYNFLVKSNDVRSANYGAPTSFFVGPRIWDTVPKVC